MIDVSEGSTPPTVGHRLMVPFEPSHVVFLRVAERSISSISSTLLKSLSPVIPPSPPGTVRETADTWEGEPPSRLANDTLWFPTWPQLDQRVRGMIVWEFVWDSAVSWSHHQGELLTNDSGVASPNVCDIVTFKYHNVPHDFVVILGFFF